MKVMKKLIMFQKTRLYPSGQKKHELWNTKPSIEYAYALQKFLITTLNVSIFQKNTNCAQKVHHRPKVCTIK